MISIVIPTYNEASTIKQTIYNTIAHAGDHEIEIIIVDGGSTDGTPGIASECGVISIISEVKGRAAQMNSGASAAKGEVIYFLHADSIPPHNFTKNIIDAIEGGAISGCFRLSFDFDHWFLKANSWFTRFNVTAVRFGDQSLFVMRDKFFQCGGFRTELAVMEDQEIIYRIKRLGKFNVMKETIITSARKYHDNGIYRMQGIFYLIWLLYYLGSSQQYLLKLYKSKIRKHKL